MAPFSLKGERLSAAGFSSEAVELIWRYCGNAPSFSAFMNRISKAEVSVQEFGVDLLDEEEKSILYRKVAALVICIHVQADARLVRSAGR